MGGRLARGLYRPPPPPPIESPPAPTRSIQCRTTLRKHNSSSSSSSATSSTKARAQHSQSHQHEPSSNTQTAGYSPRRQPRQLLPPHRQPLSPQSPHGELVLAASEHCIPPSFALNPSFCCSKCLSEVGTEGQVHPTPYNRCQRSRAEFMVSWPRSTFRFPWNFVFGTETSANLGPSISCNAGDQRLSSSFPSF